jgi:hypothetical protein
MAHQHDGVPNSKVKVTGHDQDILDGWMDVIRKSIEDQRKLGWKDSNMCVILAINSHQDAKVFLGLYLKWKASCPQIQIFFESGSISQEWPLIFVCGT